MEQAGFASAVIVVVGVGSVTIYKKEMKFHELNDIQMGTTTYNVIRNGVSTPVISDELLVGIYLKLTMVKFYQLIWLWLEEME